MINGQVYGDVSMKDSHYWGHGWAWDDTPEAYQPYMSPLMFCKGTVEVTVLPGSLQGDTASVSCKPVSSYYTLTNRTKTRTPSAGKYSLSRDWLTNGNNLIVTGNVPTFRKDLINIYDSGSFFMHTFWNASVRKESWFPNRTVLLNYCPMEQSRWLAGRLRCRKS